TLMGKFRDGMPVRAEAVTLILSSIDRIKEILAGLEATEAEPEGNDHDLVSRLEEMGERGMAAMAAARAAPQVTQGSLVEQTLERPLRPGEVSLDELERAFRETEIEVESPSIASQPEAKASDEKAEARS